MSDNKTLNKSGKLPPIKFAFLYSRLYPREGVEYSFEELMAKEYRAKEKMERESDEKYEEKYRVQITEMAAEIRQLKEQLARFQSSYQSGESAADQTTKYEV